MALPGMVAQLLPTLGVIDSMSLLILGFATLGSLTLPEEAAAGRERDYFQGVWLLMWFLMTSYLQAERGSFVAWVSEEEPQELFTAENMLNFLFAFGLELVREFASTPVRIALGMLIICWTILLKATITLHIAAFVYVPFFFSDFLSAGMKELTVRNADMMQDVSHWFVKWLARMRAAHRGGNALWYGVLCFDCLLSQIVWSFRQMVHVVAGMWCGVRWILACLFAVCHRMDRSLEFAGLCPHDLANVCLQLAVGVTIEVEIAQSTHRRGLGIWWVLMDSARREEALDWPTLVPNVLPVWICATFLRLTIEYWGSIILFMERLYQDYLSIGLQTLLEHVGIRIACR